LHTSRPQPPRPQALCTLLLRQYVYVCTSKASKALFFFIFAQVSATAPPPSLSGPLRSSCVSICTFVPVKQVNREPFLAAQRAECLLFRRACVRGFTGTDVPALLALLVQNYPSFKTLCVWASGELRSQRYVLSTRCPPACTCAFRV
jgi:hypothetical protein